MPASEVINVESLLMSFIHLKKIRVTQNGATQEYFTVPAVAISTAQGKKLIPNPSGTETCTYVTQEEAEEAIRRAGLDYVFEGQTYMTTTVKTASSRAGGEGTPEIQHDALAKGIPILIQRLNDREATVVAHSAFALGELAALQAIEPLIQLLGHEDSQVRKEAAEALAKMGGPAISHLQNAFRQAQYSKEKHAVYVRLSVISAYQFLIQCRRELLGMIIHQGVEALSDESWIVRSQAALLIGQAAPHLQDLREKT